MYRCYSAAQEDWDSTQARSVDELTSNMRCIVMFDTMVTSTHRIVLYDTIMTSFFPARTAATAESRLPATHVTTLQGRAGL